MDHRDEVQSFLNTIGERLNIGGAHLSDEGEARMRCGFDGVSLEILVLLNEEEEILSLCAAVAELPEDDEQRGELGTALLAANMLGARTRGLTFALSPRDKKMYLGYCLLWPGANYEAFESALARLVMAGAEWKKRLASVNC